MSVSVGNLGKSGNLASVVFSVIAFGSTTLPPRELVPHLPALKAPEWLLGAEGPQQECEPLEPLDRA